MRVSWRARVAPCWCRLRAAIGVHAGFGFVLDSAGRWSPCVPAPAGGRGSARGPRHCPATGGVADLDRWRRCVRLSGNRERAALRLSRLERAGNRCDPSRDGAGTRGQLRRPDSMSGWSRGKSRIWPARLNNPPLLRRATGAAGGTAGGEQAAAMRYGCRRGGNLRREKRRREPCARPDLSARSGTIDAGPTRRTPDPEPAATCRNCVPAEPVEVVRTHGDGTRRRCGNRRPKPGAAQAVPAGVDGAQETRKRGEPRKDEKFQERHGRCSRRVGQPTRRPRASDGSGQHAGDDATEEAVSRILTIPARAPARGSARWPSVTTNHAAGRWKGQTTST